MRKQEITSQAKEQAKSPENDTNEMKICDLPDREFK